MTIRPVVLWPVLMLLVPVVCCGDPRSDFDTTYAKYQSNIEKKEWALALESAESAYIQGKSLFAKNSINVGNLAFNYGELLNTFDQFAKAEQVLLSAKKILQAHFGKKSAELVNVYFELGVATYDQVKPRKGLTSLKRAIKLTANESAMERAKINFRVAVLISRKRGYSKPFFKAAYELYLAEVGAVDIRTAIAAFNLGKYALAGKDYAEARDFLQSSIEGFESGTGNLNRQMELSARAFIIPALEELGQSDVATQHCRIIGSKMPIDSDKEYLPLYKKQPVYPRKALRAGKGGWVIVEFSVDDYGFTRNYKVVKSTSDLFESASLDAVSKFRYAPQFQNGVAVVTDGVQNRIVFELAE